MKLHKCTHLSACMYSTMQSRGSYGFKDNLNASWVCTSCTCIYYMYMVCTRVEPAICEKGGGDSRRGSRGGCSGIPFPGIRYTCQRITLKDFRRYHGVTSKISGSLRSPVITSGMSTMIRHYRSTILQIALEFQGCEHRSYTFYTCAEQLHFFVKPPTYIPVHSNLRENV